MPRPAKKPAKSAAAPPLSVPPLASKARGVSWWALLADPALPREHFADAARARNVEMRSDPVWQRPELGQIGGRP